MLFVNKQKIKKRDKGRAGISLGSSVEATPKIFELWLAFIPQK